MPQPSRTTRITLFLDAPFATFTPDIERSYMYADLIRTVLPDTARTYLEQCPQLHRPGNPNRLLRANTSTRAKSKIAPKRPRGSGHPEHPGNG